MEDYDKDSKYVKGVIEILHDDVAEYLSNVNDYGDAGFWSMVSREWLHTFVWTAFDRWKVVSRASTSNCKLILMGTGCEKAFQSIDKARWFDDDWNQVLMLDICRSLGTVDYEVWSHVPEKKMTSASVTQGIKGLIRNYYGALRRYRNMSGFLASSLVSRRINILIIGSDLKKLAPPPLQLRRAR